LSAALTNITLTENNISIAKITTITITDTFVVWFSAFITCRQNTEIIANRYRFVRFRGTNWNSCETIWLYETTLFYFCNLLLQIRSFTVCRWLSRDGPHKPLTPLFLVTNSTHILFLLKVSKHLVLCLLSYTSVNPYQPNRNKTSFT
jgi:hypothetical protein